MLYALLEQTTGEGHAFARFGDLEAGTRDVLDEAEKLRRDWARQPLGAPMERRRERAASPSPSSSPSVPSGLAPRWADGGGNGPGEARPEQVDALVERLADEWASRLLVRPPPPSLACSFLPDRESASGGRGPVTLSCVR